MFELAMSEQVAAWQLNSSGQWLRMQFDAEGNKLRDFQDTIMQTIAEKKN
jgi:hypothetical protein